LIITRPNSQTEETKTAHPQSDFQLNGSPLCERPNLNKQMKPKQLQLMALALGFVGAAFTAQADLTVVPTTGSSDGNPPGTLYTVMQSLLGDPSYNVNSPANRVDDSSDQVWTSAGNSGGSTMVLTIAGYSGVNAFGIYDLADPGKTLQIFGGGTAAGTSVSITFNSGTVTVNGHSLDVGSDFGFYLATPGSPTGYWYSQESLNEESPGNYGGDHMVTLTTGTDQSLNLSAAGLGSAAVPGNVTVPWDTGSYILGWEDLPVSGPNEGDNDYQDMIVEVSGVTPVPEATTIIAGALLLLPLGASTLRILRRSRTQIS
jgi:Domain of unknown function (DUF4114)